MTKLIFILALIILGFGSEAQVKTDSGRMKLNDQCDKFMQDFQNAKFSEGIQLLKQNSTLGESFVDNLDKTMSAQMVNVLANYKKITGYELIEEKVIKNVLVRRRYLLKFEVFFLTFDFYLYNNGSNWVISGFYYKDEQKDLF